MLVMFCELRLGELRKMGLPMEGFEHTAASSFKQHFQVNWPLFTEITNTLHMVNKVVADP